MVKTVLALMYRYIRIYRAWKNLFIDVFLNKNAFPTPLLSFITEKQCCRDLGVLAYKTYFIYRFFRLRRLVDGKSRPNNGRNIADSIGLSRKSRGETKVPGMTALMCFELKTKTNEPHYNTETTRRDRPRRLVGVTRSALIVLFFSFGSIARTTKFF